MTYKEKLMQIKPAAVNEEFCGGCSGCPSDYGLDDLQDDECVYNVGEFESNYEKCSRCWNREFPEPTPVIKDSGERRQFDTGAVRDIQEGKGRCDLMPLDVVGDILYTSPLESIAVFQKTGDVATLKNALCEFNQMHYKGFATLFLEVSRHFEEGAKKYGENNWQKGIPVRCYIDSAVRHYLKWLRGDKDEPHDRAFCWNIICAIWTCNHKPELNDYAVKESDI